MNANRIAKKLKAHGLTVISVTEGTEDVDGMVKITEGVHVQVPTFGRGVCVVAETPESRFRFYRARKANDVEGIAEDVQSGLLVAAGVDEKAATSGKKGS